MRTTTLIAEEYINLIDNSNSKPLLSLFSNEYQYQKFHNNLRELLEKFRYNYLTFVNEEKIIILVKDYIEHMSGFIAVMKEKEKKRKDEERTKMEEMLKGF